MQIIQMRCPKCGGELEVEDGLETFFCKYCGQKIVLAEQSEHIVKAKVDIEKLKHEERMYQLKIERDREENAELNKRLKIALIVFGTIGVGCIIGGIIAEILSRI